MSVLNPVSSHRGGRTTLVVLLLVVPLVTSMMAGAYMNHPDCRTGAPGEGTCADCHKSYALNTGDGYVMVAGLPEQYEPGKSYTLTVSVYSPGMIRYCFEMVIMPDDDEQPTGSFVCLDTTETKISGQYIKTTMNGFLGATEYCKSWNVQWNSPSKAEYPVTFYCVGMGSDCDNDENGDRTYTCMMKVHPAPKTPVQPRGVFSEPGDGQIALSWYMPVQPDPAGGQVTYNVYWSETLTGGLTLLSTVSSTEYVHTGLANGRTYRYQISALNSKGEGPLSEVVKAVPDLVPDSPRRVQTQSAAQGAIQLSWDDPGSWGADTSGSYSIYRGEAPWDVELVANQITARSYQDTTGLQPNTTYHYRVVAVNSRGAGGVATHSVHLPPSSPSFPLDLSVMVNRGTVELTWQPPSVDGGDTVRGYRVYRQAAGREPVMLIDHLEEACFSDSTAEPGKTYEYTVAAVNVAGEGALSTPVEAYIMPPPSSGDTGEVSVSGIPFSGLVLVGAVILIGAVMVARLSVTTGRVERKDED